MRPVELIHTVANNGNGNGNGIFGSNGHHSDEEREDKEITIDQADALWFGSRGAAAQPAQVRSDFLQNIKINLFRGKFYVN